MTRKASVRYCPGRKGDGCFCVYMGERRELALGPDDSPAVPPIWPPWICSRRS